MLDLLAPEDPPGKLPHASTNEFAHNFSSAGFAMGLRDMDGRDDLM